MPPIWAPVDRLLDRGAGFVTIGGVAAVVHGFAFVTRDLDTCYGRTPTSLGRSIGPPTPPQPRRRGDTADIPFKRDAKPFRAGLNFTLDTDRGAIDLVGEVAGMRRHDAVVQTTEAVPPFGRSCRVPARGALVRSERATGRRRGLDQALEAEGPKEPGERQKN